MKEYLSPRFSIIKEPENVIELMQIVIGNNYETEKTVKLWRGQSNIEWAIDSGAFRRLKRYKDKISDMDIFNYEKSLLRRARHKGYGVENGIILSDMELLSKLQHHGAATRLVDFSKNSLVALWFCVNDLSDENYGLLIGIDINYVGGGEEVFPEEFGSYDNAIESLEDGGLRLIEPPVVSKRIAAQHGVFLYSNIVKTIRGSLDISPHIQGNVFIAISPELKKHVKKVLIETFDIRKETLFPDLDGFSTSNNVFHNPYSSYRW